MVIVWAMNCNQYNTLLWAGSGYDRRWRIVGLPMPNRSVKTLDVINGGDLKVRLPTLLTEFDFHG
jgi:hypothetical protein